MRTSEKLQLAHDLVKEAESLLGSIDNESLQDFYGYSIDNHMAQLNMLSDNSRDFMGRQSTLEEIKDASGDKWKDKEEGDYESCHVDGLVTS